MEQTSTPTASPSNGIDVKKAVRIATDYIRQVFSDENIKNILLEEIQRTEDFQQSEWRITIGMDRASKLQNNPMLAGTAISTMERVYKVVDIDARSGQVKGIRMR